MPIVSIERLTKSDGRTAALQGVSFDVEPGEITSAAVVMFRASMDAASLAWWEAPGAFVVLADVDRAQNRREIVPRRPPHVRCASDVQRDHPAGAAVRVAYASLVRDRRATRVRRERQEMSR